jgi:autophagy-related protein 2
MDSNLPSQYEYIPRSPDANSGEQHSHLPVFKIMDQMDRKHCRDVFQPMLWHSRGSHKHNLTNRTHKVGSLPSAVDKLQGSTNACATVFKVDVKRQEYSSRQRKPVLEVEVHVVPMHIFVDLGQVLRKEGNWSFLSEVIGDELDSTGGLTRSDIEQTVSHQAGTGDSEADTPPASPRSCSVRENRKERQRQDLVLDPDLDHREKDFNHEWGHNGKGSRKVELCFSALFNTSYRFSSASHSSDKFEGVGEDRHDPASNSMSTSSGMSSTVWCPPSRLP